MAHRDRSRTFVSSIHDRGRGIVGLVTSLEQARELLVSLQSSMRQNAPPVFTRTQSWELVYLTGSLKRQDYGMDKYCKLFAVGKQHQ